MQRHIYLQVEYNLWANEKIAELLRSLDVSVLESETFNSFPSIIKTIQHISFAENIWRQRINQNSYDPIAFSQEELDPQQALKQFIFVSKELLNFSRNLSESDLRNIVKFVTGEGKELTNSIERILFHVVNHSSYHRGQVITMLKQLGVSQAISTDLYFFYQTL